MKTIICIILISFSTFPSFAQDINYGDTSNWVMIASQPIIESDYFAQSLNDSIDVFYVYPTLNTSKKDERWNIPLNDLEQRDKVMNVVEYQASAWSASGKVYVPYYRQAHLRSYSHLDGCGKDALLFAYKDVKQAFEYYIKYFNNGKGIILAGHSQGSTHLSMILHDYFDGKPLQKQLVAAYIPGIGFAVDEYNTIPLMLNADETGGFVSWNTHKRRIDKPSYKWHKGKAVVNPITWDTTSFIDRSLHKGFLFSNDKLYVHSFNTHVIDGAIWVTTPHFPFRYLAFTMRNYHIGDVNFFWKDISENALLRSVVYLKNKPD